MTYPQTAVKGTVIARVWKFQTIPVPEHTPDQNYMVLALCCSLEMGDGQDPNLKLCVNSTSFYNNNFENTYLSPSDLHLKRGRGVVGERSR